MLPLLLEPADLAKHTLIHDVSAEVDPSCPDWTSWLKARGAGATVDSERGPRFNQSALAIEAAATGRGVVLAKRAIAASDLAAGRLIAPFADGSISVDYGYWLVWPKGRHLTEDVRAFIKWVKAVAAESEVAGV